MPKTDWKFGEIVQYFRVFFIISEIRHVNVLNKMRRKHRRIKIYTHSKMKSTTEGSKKNSHTKSWSQSLEQLTWLFSVFMILLFAILSTGRIPDFDAISSFFTRLLRLLIVYLFVQALFVFFLFSGALRMWTEYICVCSQNSRAITNSKHDFSI